jgi:hypothetical protein
MTNHLHVRRFALGLVLASLASLLLAPGIAPAKKKRSPCAKLHESKGCLIKAAQYRQKGTSTRPEIVLQANQPIKRFGPAYLYFFGGLQCIEHPGEDNALGGRFDLRVNQKPRVGSTLTLTGSPFTNGSLRPDSPYKATALVTYTAKFAKVDLTITYPGTESYPACTYRYSAAKVKRDH